jgi:beta-xylosidase
MNPDSWTRSTKVFDVATGAPNCTFFRPQAVYNPNTKLYVVWVNAALCGSVCPKGFGGTCYSTATSPKPDGPFTFTGNIIPNATLTGPKSGYAGDYALFVDKDGSGYCILTHGIAGAGHRDMYIFKLSLDYLSFTDSFAGPLQGSNLVEAPVLFNRGDMYYALIGGCTCAGLHGSGVGLLTASR